MGIALANESFGIVEGNMVTNSMLPGISINNSTAFKLNNNKVSNTNGSPGILIVNGAVVHEMVGNGVDAGKSPRFQLGKGATVE